LCPFSALHSMAHTAPAAPRTTYARRATYALELIFHDHFHVFAQSTTPSMLMTTARSVWNASPAWSTTPRVSPVSAATVFRGIQCTNPMGGPLHRLCPSCSEANPSVRRIPGRAAPPT
jgi:hypothetical protein